MPAGQTGERLPVLVLLDGRVLVDPSNQEVADALGGAEAPPPRRGFDVIVIGGGPAVDLFSVLADVPLAVRVDARGDNGLFVRAESQL